MVEQLFRENEIKTNKLVAVAFEVIGLVVMAGGAVACVRFSDNPFKQFYKYLIIYGALVLISCIVAYKKYSEKPNTKIYLIGIVLLTSGVLNFLYPTVSIFISFGVILMSAKYYNSRLTLITSAFSAVIFVLAVAVSYYLYHHSETFYSYLLYLGALIYKYALDMVIFYVVPRLCVMGITAFLCVMIADGGRQLVIKQSEAMLRSYEMKKDIEAAAVIQQHSMPELRYSTPDDAVSLRAFVQPAKDVGGDMFDYFMINSHILVVVISDISDKGLASALYSSRVKSACRYAFAELLDMGDAAGTADIELGEVVEKINRVLCANNKDNYFATACIMCLDCNDGAIKYVNAGHEMPVIRHNDGSSEIVENNPMMVMGLFSTSKYMSEELQLAEGDSIVLYTDGLTDARNVEDVKYDEMRLLESLQSVEADSYEKLPDSLIESATLAVNEFIGEADQFDDITALALTFCGDEYRYKYIEAGADEDGVASIEKVLNDYMIKLVCPNDFRRIMCTAIDEVIGNIADYSYADTDDDRYIRVKYGVKCNELCIEFRDGGRKFNPLDVESPNTDELSLGGYGIMLVKEIADSVEYRYENGENVLTLRKAWLSKPLITR